MISLFCSLIGCSSLGSLCDRKELVLVITIDCQYPPYKWDMIHNLLNILKPSDAANITRNWTVTLIDVLSLQNVTLDDSNIAHVSELCRMTADESEIDLGTFSDKILRLETEILGENYNTSNVFIIHIYQKDSKSDYKSGHPFSKREDIKNLNIAILDHNDYSMSKIINDTIEVASQDDLILLHFTFPTFLCDGIESSLSYNYVCDGILDCPNGEDEQVCNYDFEDLMNCRKRGYFICRYPNVHGLKCIAKSQLCDMIEDCPDGSDETNCDDCILTQCSPNVCIPDHWSLNCTSANQIEISKNHGKLSKMERSLIIFCNEHDADYTKGSKYNRIWAPRCIYITNRQGSHIGCSYTYHLNNCKHFICPEGHFKCLDDYCIPDKLKNDGFEDCPNGEDEFPHILKDIYFQCFPNANLINPIFICDGKSHCTRGDDELNCIDQCPSGFICLDGTVSVNDTNTLLNIGENLPAHQCETEEQPLSTCEDLIGDSVKRVLLWIVAICAVFGNMIALGYRILFERATLHQTYVLFVTCLGVSDLLMGVYLVIIASVDVVYRNVFIVHEHSWKQSTLCQIAGTLATLSSETSTFFILLITFERFLTIRFPFGEHKISNLGKYILISVAWCLGALLSVVPSIYSDLALYSTSEMCLGFPLRKSFGLAWTYSVTIFLFFNSFLFVVIATGQLSIFLAIYRHSSKFKTENQTSARRADNITVALKLSVVVLSNFICWFPVCIMGIRTVVSDYEVRRETYSWVIALVLPINSALNPILYTVPRIYTFWKNFNNRKTKHTHGSNVSNIK
ncbi:G-protein coupled receptor GRL101 [Biomphalaria glabrata]|nr:G-protein coupled receptor GRL101 [Biomphalaria glabrata]